MSIKEYYRRNIEYFNDMAAASPYWHELNDNDVACLEYLYGMEPDEDIGNTDAVIVNLDHCIIHLMQRR